LSRTAWKRSANRDLVGQEEAMPRPISIDLRTRIVELYRLSGVTYEHIAHDLGIGRATVSRILRLHRESGSVEPKPQNGGAPRKITGAGEAELLDMLEKQPDATLQDLTCMWNKRHLDNQVSSEAVRMCLLRAGYTYKKRRFAPSSETSSASRS
jgi:transposase